MIKLLTDDHYENIMDLFDSTEKSIKIVSPFLSMNMAKKLCGVVKQNNISCRFITRLYLEDMFSKANDLDALKLMIESGIEVLTVKGLHTKLYIFDDIKSVVGSANFTSGGFISNIELSLLAEDEPELLTNFTAAPAAVASAAVTASFGIAEQAHLFRAGSIDEENFIENSEIICVDAAVSALSSFAGQVLIPVPILGAVIGNTVGTLIYEAGKDKLSEKEQSIINGYLQEIERFDSRLNTEYQNAIAVIRSNFAVYVALVSDAFSPDLKTALDGSVSLAQSMGVPVDELLCNKKQIASYFLD